MQHPILNQAEIKDRYSFYLGGQSPFDIGIPLLFKLGSIASQKRLN